MEEYLRIKNKFIENTNKLPIHLLDYMHSKCGFIFDCNDGKITAISQEHKASKDAA